MGQGNKDSTSLLQARTNSLFLGKHTKLLTLQTKQNHKQIKQSDKKKKKTHSNVPN